MTSTAAPTTTALPTSAPTITSAPAVKGATSATAATAATAAPTSKKRAFLDLKSGIQSDSAFSYYPGRWRHCNM